MIKIKLNKNEYLYLTQMNFISKNHKVTSDPNVKDIFILECTADQADEIRDKCSEKLQFVAFNEKYELTNEGKLLENLIDELFMG
jgi:hypothetical protein